MDVHNRNLTLPNVLTVMRLLITPGFILAFLNGRLVEAWWLFTAAGVTDALDGFLARVLDQRSRLGAVLDPLADKVLVVTAFLLLGHQGWLPQWLVVTVISRDVLIVGGMALLNMWGVDVLEQVAPTMLSKCNTTAQLGLVFLSLAQRTFEFGWPGTERALVAAVGALTVTTGMHYIVVGLSLFPASEKDHGQDSDKNPGRDRSGPGDGQ